MKRLKRILLAAFTMAILFSILTIHAVTVSAAEAGTLPSNAITLTDGVWQNKHWTNNNYNLNCYNKIVVPSRGYITFTASKPIDSKGEFATYDLILFDENENIVWQADTWDQKKSFSEYYTYKIGLAAGTYFMNIDPDLGFYVSPSESIDTKHKFTFTKASNWEIESNNNQAEATEIALGKKYYGVYTDESYDSSYKDYFKIKLTKGRDYRITIGNYSELDAGTALDKFLDPQGEDILPYNYKESGNSIYYDITAEYSGWYYFLLYNDGNSAGVEYTLQIDSPKQSCESFGFSLSTTSYTYNGVVKKPAVTVKDLVGKTLKQGTDYTVTYPSGRKNVGTYKVTVTMKGNYTGTKTLTFKINPAKIGSCQLSTTSYTYNGVVKKPAVTVKNSNGTKLSASTYTVTYSSGRKNVGTYKVTIKGKGNYTGTKTLTFKINPAKTTVSKLTAGQKSITVGITKKSTQVTGYQIQYSTSKSFTNAKTKTITSYKTTKYTLKSLSAKKTYYVRVRTYKTVNGTKYYSGWSTYKYIKTK